METFRNNLFLFEINQQLLVGNTELQVSTHPPTETPQMCYGTYKNLTLHQDSEQVKYLCFL